MLESTWNILNFFLGDWGVGVLSTILFISIIRIFIAVVFKMFRFNIDYHTLVSKNRTWNQHDKLK